MHLPSPVPTRRLSRLPLPLLLGLSLLLLVVAGAVTAAAMLKLRNSQQWVLHSNEVLLSVTKIEAATQRARAAARTYLLSARSEVLVEFRTQQRALLAGSDALIASVADNPAQVARARAIQLAVEPMLAAYSDEVQANAIGSSGRPARQRLTVAIEAFTTAEVDLLNQRLEATRAAGVRGMAALAVTVAMALVLLAAVVVLVRRSAQADAARRLAALDASRLSAEASLLQREEEFETLADNISQLAWMADPDGDIYWYNRRWFDYTGSSLVQMAGWGWTAVHDPALVDGIKDRFEQAIKAGSDWEDTFPLRGADGSFRWFLSRAKPVKDAGGRVLRWFGTNTDITEVRQAQTSLIDAALRKDEFLAVLSHELRNPLSPMLVAARLLASPGVTPERRAWCSDVVLRQGAHLSQLVDDLLDASRITRGRLDLDRKPVDVGRIVAMAVEAAQPLIDARGHRLQVQVATGIPLLEADPVRLSQVLTNLLNNACKFTEPQGQIILTVSRPDGVLLLSVSDTGVGLAPADLGMVFDMFGQVRPALARPNGGLGIGLALSKRIVELHGGTIQVSSDGPGRGAVFSVTLPLPELPGAVAAESPVHTAVQPWVPPSSDDALPPAVPATGPLPMAGPADAPRVLVADDNQDAADSLADLLRLMGYAVVVAYDGEQALSAAAAFAPRLAVLDIGMPKLNGYEVAAGLRALPASANITLIALTGWGQDSDKLRAASAGFDHHLTKPVDLDALAGLIVSCSAADSALADTGNPAADPA